MNIQIPFLRLSDLVNLTYGPGVHILTSFWETGVDDMNSQFRSSCSDLIFVIWPKHREKTAFLHLYLKQQAVIQPLSTPPYIHLVIHIPKCLHPSYLHDFVKLGTLGKLIHDPFSPTKFGTAIIAHTYLVLHQENLFYVMTPLKYRDINQVFKHLPIDCNPQQRKRYSD